MSIQDIISKVQKLRALSKSANLNEAMNAAAIAERLISEHRLTEAELSAEKKISEPIIEAQTYLYESGKIVQWKSMLALLLAKHYGVYIYNNCDYSNGRKKTRYAMVGRESDIQILQYNFNYLVREISELCDLLRVSSGSRGVSIERNSFCFGAVDGIVGRLRVEKKSVEMKATSVALVVINNKLMDYGSYARGKEAGGNIQIK